MIGVSRCQVYLKVIDKRSITLIAKRKFVFSVETIFPIMFVSISKSALDTRV